MGKLVSRFTFAIALSSVLTVFSVSAFASAFQIWEQSAYGTGDYHAGAAAEGGDASSEFYNPAQVTLIKHQQISTGGVLIPVKVDFKGSVTNLTNITSTTPAGGVTSNTLSFIPNFHYVLPLGRWRLIFGETTPFGLETNYPAVFSNAASQAATKTSLRTINLSPGFAVQLTSKLSIGAAFDALYGNARYNNIVNFAGTPFTFKNYLSGWSYGYNLGALYQFTDKTRLGISYRSSMHLKASGTSRFQGSPDTTVTTTFPLPATTIASLYQGINQHWAVMGSVAYTQWADFTTLVLHNVALGGINITVHENYRNTWNFAVGAHYTINDAWVLKAGTGYDQTPTKTGFRDIRLPDTYRIPLSLGVHWNVSNRVGLEAGYTHLFTPTATIDNRTSSKESQNLVPAQVGVADMSANVFAMQVTINL